jgi:hypothetical protein
MVIISAPFKKREMEEANFPAPPIWNPELEMIVGTGGWGKTNARPSAIALRQAFW